MCHDIGDGKYPGISSRRMLSIVTSTPKSRVWCQTTRSFTQLLEPHRRSVRDYESDIADHLLTLWASPTQIIMENDYLYVGVWKGKRAQ